MDIGGQSEIKGTNGYINVTKSHIVTVPRWTTRTVSVYIFYAEFLNFLYSSVLFFSIRGVRKEKVAGLKLPLVSLSNNLWTWIYVNIMVKQGAMTLLPRHTLS